MGTVMNTKAAPMFANIFKEKIDKWVLSVSSVFAHFFKILIDDIFMLWPGSDIQFQYFIKPINSIHHNKIL
jgi:hypothetical protein